MTDLVGAVSPWLQALARGCGLSHSSAEDVAQTTLLVLVRQIHLIRSPEAGLAWLAVVARREAVSVARVERAVRLVADIGAEEPCPAASGPEAIAIAAIRRDLLWRHVEELPDRAQVILREVAHVGRPNYAAISRQTGMPVGSIGPTRRRSLARVKRLLEVDEGLWLSA
jgi:DNA-directed RNA polymerase specialized sigma24 family protein